MIALFFDTETTGFRSKSFTPEIVQIAAIVQDTETMQVYAQLNVIVKTENPIPEKVSAIHGITDDIADKYGINSRLAEKMFSELVFMSDLMVAHNIAFDADIIDGAWPLTGQMISKKSWYCTMRELVPVLKLPRNGNAFHNSIDENYKAPKLIEAFQYYFQRDFSNAHNAMSDTEACRDVFFARQAEIGIAQ